MNPLLSDLALILIVAGIVTVLFKKLKQPVVLGYIVAGVLAGPYISFIPTVTNVHSILYLLYNYIRKRGNFPATPLHILNNFSNITVLP